MISGPLSLPSKHGQAAHVAEGRGTQALISTLPGGRPAHPHSRVLESFRFFPICVHLRELLF